MFKTEVWKIFCCGGASLCTMFQHMSRNPVKSRGFVFLKIFYCTLKFCTLKKCRALKNFGHSYFQTPVIKNFSRKFVASNAVNYVSPSQKVTDKLVALGAHFTPSSLSVPFYGYLKLKLRGSEIEGPGWGVLPCISYTRTCCPSGYDFSTVRS